ncbi:MAG: RelA/SpoT family protein [Bacteroidota bacterium]
MEVLEPEVENKEIVRRYRRLLKFARPMLHDNDAALVRKAFETAVDAHKEMRRKSGEPYIYHPIAVAQICVEEIGLGTTSIIAALLHDTVEDTDMELSDIERMFGNKVMRIIDGLTKISGVTGNGQSAQAENFRKMLLTLGDDIRVILIKLADRLHNMRTLDSMPRNTQLKIASETIYLYAPLAHRLGLYSIKSELEDLYLKYTEKDTYLEIKDKIQQTKAARNKFIKDFMAPLENELAKQEFRVTIKGRPKSIYSIWNKIKKNKVRFEEIYDLFAIRVIIDTARENEKSACWQVYSIVTDVYKPNPDRLRDHVSTPKSNGYESLHTTVMSKSGQWVEVQIRSERMDEIAEKGFAAHWKYKENTEHTRENGIEMWLMQVRDLLENNKTSAIDFVNDFRNNLFAEEVYVFTPDGDLKILPAGATALDFAFDVHSQVGARCIGAKVNQRLVPISHKLVNGDQIEILTSAKQKPTEDWIKFVVTGKAISKIRESLKEDRKKLAMEGKEVLVRKLKGLKMNLNEETLTDLRKFFEVKSNTDLYCLFQDETLNVTDLKRYKEFLERKLTHEIAPEEQQALQDGKTFEKELKKVRTDTDSLLIGENQDKFDYTLSQCCNPIPGDDVFGFITVDQGIKIHRTSCTNAAGLMANYGYRIIKTRWASQKEESFQTGLHITGTDRVGLVNDVTKIISSQLKVNMRSISIGSKDGIFEGTIQLFVHDTLQLDKLITRLKKVGGIVSVNRFDA